MATKWDEKDVMEHAQKLKSPFENLRPNKLGNPDEVLKAIRDRGNGAGRQRLPQGQVR